MKMFPAICEFSGKMLDGVLSYSPSAVSVPNTIEVSKALVWIGAYPLLLIKAALTAFHIFFPFTANPTTPATPSTASATLLIIVKTLSI